VIQFAYPLALTSLLAIPAILVLYLLRPRPRRVLLSTTTLWQAALRDRERGLGLRKLLRDLSLLLLLAIAALLGLALAGPQWLTGTGERADTVLILDVSASMQARAGLGRTRFDQALAEADAIVDGMPREGRMLVMTSGRKAQLRTGFESDRSALRRVLSQLRPTDEAGRPREALALALALLKGREDGRVYFLTDGAFDAEADPGSPRIVYRMVDGTARNVAITRFALRQEPGNKDRYQVLLTVRNYTDARMTVPASVSIEGRTLFARSLEIEARGEQTLALPFSGRALGRAIASIQADDDLAADNQAFAAIDADTPVSVLLFSAGNVFLESVLEALPGVALVRREWSPAEDIAQVARLHDVVVFDGVPAPRLPPGNFLLVNTIAPGLPFTDAGRVTRPAVAGRGASALMRDVDLAAVRIDEARRVALGGEVPGLQRLFWSRDTELALALIDDAVKLVYLGFDLSQSNFPLQVAFPLFVSHSLDWLRPRADGWVSTHIEAGATHALPVPAGNSQITLRPPSGNAMTLAATSNGTLRFDATTVAGIYQYAAGDATGYFAVSLADARESDVNRRWQPGARASDAAAATNSAQTLVPLWPHLLALALLLLALEWLVWHASRSHA
jgi:hypothetical protein